MIVLGIDPGFATFGWAVVAYADRRSIILELGAGETDLRRVPGEAMADDVRRAGEVLTTILRAARRPNVKIDLVGTESVTGGRGARAARGFGIATGVVAATGIALKALVACVTPADVKASVGLPPDATKDAVIGAVQRRFVEAPGRFAAIAPRLRQHAADALAVVECVAEMRGFGWGG